MIRRADVEAMLDALSGGWPWHSYDGGLSALLDEAVLIEEEITR